MAKQVTDDTTFTAVRLPSAIKPVHYDLSLKPNFNDFTFSGQVKIDYITNEAPPSSIVLHAQELTITDGAIEAGSKSSPLTTVTYSPANQAATLEFQDAIAPQGSINLNFEGILNDKLKGFYRTSFKIDGHQVYAATTQFESTDARRCFPCWDEPAIKATFSVTITVEKFIDVNGKKYERLVLSNMPEISRSGPDTAVEVKFDKSPIMSTYLLAFIVGPFDVIEGTDGKRPVRVFTTPGKSEQGRFALDMACRSLPYYEQYFNIPYPLPKMDLVAIPDFMSGAMENWGLVTYRETCILYDPKNSSINLKQWIAIVVAHELAHQWFGNLVTMEWWTHLWLNEGFASFMEYLCTDHIFPEYNVWSQFLSQTYGSALSLDALHNSHPIEVPVNHASEIEEIFDDISYAKGASVIRMLYTYIGDESFRKGMKDYLTKFAYKNAQTEDLWDCLEAASGKPVRKIMSGWTSQKGYPWLSIGYAKDGDKVKLTLTQSKFSSDGALPEGDASNLWMVPISVVTGNNPTVSKEVSLLQNRSEEITIDNVGEGWVKLNPGTVGLYRCAYPAEMMSKLVEAISQQTLSPADRLGLQSDYHALCEAGKVGSVDLLKLLLAFKKETEYNVWTSIDSSISRLSSILYYTDSLDKLRAFARELYSEIFEKLGWDAKDGEKHMVTLTRVLVIRRLIAMNHPGVVEEAKKRFKDQQNGGTPIAADLRAAVYRAVALYGDDSMFEQLYTIYRTADLSEEKSRTLQALGSATDVDRLQRSLNFCLSDEVRNQDKIFILCPAGVVNPQVAWKFFKDNSATIKKHLGPSPLMTRVVKATSENFASEEMAQEVTKFYEENKFEGSERSVKQSVEHIRLNASWLSRDGEAIKNFLASY